MPPVAPLMLPALLALGVLMGGCSSTHSRSVPVSQLHEVECVASNTEKSGCKTSHSFIIDLTAVSEGEPDFTIPPDEDTVF
ncbi:hypothetical protein [Pelagibacterium montanilacus]|uniref:hypothetical protein n=1 Tax=Pelagibacterium montanilacus TaxID=2185280 RepID=UPI000F8E2129|nr:hypothetical protein [Pelagibacterium montanilacus]